MVIASDDFDFERRQHGAGYNRGSRGRGGSSGGFRSFFFYWSVDGFVVCFRGGR